MGPRMPSFGCLGPRGADPVMIADPAAPGELTGDRPGPDPVSPGPSPVSNRPGAAPRMVDQVRAHSAELEAGTSERDREPPAPGCPTAERHQRPSRLGRARRRDQGPGENQVSRRPQLRTAGEPCQL